jgi:hypothetical protein
MVARGEDLPGLEDEDALIQGDEVKGFLFFNTTDTVLFFKVAANLSDKGKRIVEANSHSQIQSNMDCMQNCICACIQDKKCACVCM